MKTMLFQLVCKNEKKVKWLKILDKFFRGMEDDKTMEILGR